MKIKYTLILLLSCIITYGQIQISDHTKVNDENSPKWAWTYLYNGESDNEINSGNWRDRD